jgi:hypothetical protein
MQLENGVECCGVDMRALADQKRERQRDEGNPFFSPLAFPILVL